MREHSYRAFNKTTKQILDVVEISWYSHNVRCVIGGQMENPCTGEVELDYDFPLFEMKDVELLEYTGLKDKNGKDLDWWEGDLLKLDDNHSGTWPIEWDEDGGCFSCGAEILGNIVLSYKAEKVGNIHENPELLNV